ncbi:MAG: nucleosidase [Alphaproteobacteria bacterium]|nr:nucleosidase [Alphaproteobacteria bacterium]
MERIAPGCMAVFALEAEARGLFGGYDVVYCGVGKINAAHRLTRALMEWQQAHGAMPRLVLNLGSAGSPQFKTGTIVNCTGFIQRDFDVSAFGYMPHLNPFDKLPPVLETGLRLGSHPEGICGTGDSFVADGAREKPWNVMDMEAYALARVCEAEQIPFGCLKYITDGADADAASVWEERLEAAAHALRQAAGALDLAAV